MKTFFYGLFICCLLLGCSTKIKEGEICEREYIPAHTDIVMLPMVTYSNNVCITTLYPMPFFYPDAYQITIKSFRDEDWVYRTLYIPKEVYDQTQVGGYYVMGDGDFDDQPRERTK
jgi:hypothetical protein